MAYLRKLPSGKWQATIRTAGGRKVSRTDSLKKVVSEWAKQAELDVARGKWSDPRSTSIKVSQWWEKYVAAKRVEEETARADQSSWKLHLEPFFGSRDIATLKPIDVETWVTQRIESGVGPSAIRRALNLLKALLESAVDNQIITHNVARKVRPPQEKEPIVEWFTADEVDAVLAEMYRRGWDSMAVMTLLMIWTGLRWGEAAALNVEDFDFQRGTIIVSHTLTQAGRDKPYPKTDTSADEIPCPDHVMETVKSFVGSQREGRLFTTRRGAKNLSGGNWRKDWDVVLRAAGVRALHPHVCRHTCASWLVQSGVPLYNVSKQLRHASIVTTQRYAHLAPDVHDPVRDAWAALAITRRT